MKGKKKKGGNARERERENIQMVENIFSTFGLEFPRTMQDC